VLLVTAPCPLVYTNSPSLAKLSQAPAVVFSCKRSRRDCCVLAVLRALQKHNVGKRRLRESFGFLLRPAGGDSIAPSAKCSSYLSEPSLSHDAPASFAKIR